MKYKIALLLIASAVLATAGGGYIYYTMSATPTATSAPLAQAPRVHTLNGETVVLVSIDVQRASHMAVVPLTTSTLQPETTAYTTVIDLQPLFDLHNRIVAARSSRQSARAQADASRAQYQRDYVLFHDNRNISQKSLQDARAVMLTDQAKQQAAEAAQNVLDATLRQQFGTALANASAAPGSDLLQRLMGGRSEVLLVTLPAKDGVSAPTQISVDSPDGRLIAAHKLSASPQSDPSIQGSPYFYAADSILPVGTRTTAHIPLKGKSRQGLLIPESAVIWYGGQQWAYVKTAADQFTRRYLPSAPAVDGGFVVTSGFRAGEEVVIRGAQLLLSEELRPQDIATQCKDPPECDG
ncbi:efflux RND transporter periplasmic adaptor subunit [Eoetvoesiella caeni]|uniref:Multidrug efflux pump subunit AcrA (Membrane-fusion protein) n=1 Tax=Eoetvoesiella caeni TaxID=645616 RepID=A0A366H1L8_9BURK|nr:efflux RND transporter periplasmic adaptor subunit [Eoetvoesiella caeni]MCI2810953.1 efflux RND transporter periplasmic adaptor subunit [Eoetvoesiella caeni]NYT56852.1 metal transporter [Eoetvoesiella caeni]RBP35416.1 multidrug efflux pump subunit AcrA (membrane-fusion protein) [Eoetvoesiella caeni]